VDDLITTPVPCVPPKDRGNLQAHGTTFLRTKRESSPTFEHAAATALPSCACAR
jgi:hypothetical protein